MRVQSGSLHEVLAGRILPLARIVLTVGMPLAFLSVFFVVPLIVIAFVSLATNFPGTVSSLTLSNYSLLWHGFYVEYIIGTVEYGLEVVIITLLIGYPIALYMVRRGGAEYQLILLAVVTPLLVGVVPRTVGWTILLGVEGSVNQLLVGSGLIQQPAQMLYTPGAAIAGMVQVLLPFMVLSIVSSLSTISPSLGEAASGLGATPWQAFRKVTLPLSSRGMGVGCALVFSLAIGAYITPVVLGGGKMKLLGPLAYDQFTSIVNWPLGSAVSMSLLGIGLLFVIGLPVLLDRGRKQPATATLG